MQQAPVNVDGYRIVGGHTKGAATSADGQFTVLAHGNGGNHGAGQNRDGTLTKIRRTADIQSVGGSAPGHHQITAIDVCPHGQCTTIDTISRAIDNAKAEPLDTRPQV